MNSISLQPPNNYLKLFLTGFAMGSADVVPGVSGGTVAFILGVYERLIHSIKTLSGETLKLAFKLQIIPAFKSAPLGFLIPLGLGILTAVLTFAEVLSHLLETQPVLTWSFFFGLIIASTILVGKRVQSWGTQTIIGLIAGAIIAYLITELSPVATPATPLAFLLSGAIAICAMILPGISGSFLLILMGKYQQILDAVTDRDIATLGIFMIGAAIGLALFSRLLSWLFKHHHDLIISLLTGFLVGSLNKVWPWKRVLEYRTNSNGEIEPFLTKNILPVADDPLVLWAVGLCLLAVVVVITLEKLGSRQKQNTPGK